MDKLSLTLTESEIEEIEGISSRLVEAYFEDTETITEDIELIKKYSDKISLRDMFCINNNYILFNENRDNWSLTTEKYNKILLKMRKLLISTNVENMKKFIESKQIKSLYGNVFYEYTVDDSVEIFLMKVTGTEDTYLKIDPSEFNELLAAIEVAINGQEVELAEYEAYLKLKRKYERKK